MWLWLVLVWAWLAGAKAGNLLAQSSGGIQGNVTDSWEGNPLSGVNVTIRGTTLATRADLQGKFLLSGVPQGNHIIIFTKSGYARATISDVGSDFRSAARTKHSTAE